MSTRGAIAKALSADGEQWVGIYNHFDSYPTGLGASIFSDVVDKYDGFAIKFIADRIDAKFDGDGDLIWSTDGQDEPLFIEWVYVLEPATNTMLVLTGCPAPSQTYLLKTWDDKKLWQLKQRQLYRWEYVDRVYFGGSEPPWTLIERSGTDLCDRRLAESEEARPDLYGWRLERTGFKRK